MSRFLAPCVATATRSMSFWFAVLTAFSLAGPLPSARADITSEGNVYPDPPSTWTWSTEGHIGYTSGTVTTGTVTVDGGSGLLSSYAYIGYDGSATGVVNVSGTGSTWTNYYDLYVGYSGNGTLAISDGGAVTNGFGYIGYESGSAGTATVDGPGSTWTNYGILYVGYSGAGTVNVSNGGTISGQGYIGFNPGSTGAVTVDGFGSTWNALTPNGGSLYVGGSGSATLNITNGATVSSGNGGTTLSDCVIGCETGSAGTVTVDGIASNGTALSTWTVYDNLVVGYSGNGTLKITNGGKVVAATPPGGPCECGDTYVGFNDGSVGTIEFGMNGGTASGTLYTRSLLVKPSQLIGSGGTTTEVYTRGLVTDINLTFDGDSVLDEDHPENYHGLHQTKLTVGTAIVDLDMTNWDSSCGFLGAGWTESGSLTIRSTSTEHAINVPCNYGLLGYHSGSMGVATVSGTGSTWTILGRSYATAGLSEWTSLDVGYYGSGELTISDGGTILVNAPWLSGYGLGFIDLGRYSGGAGTVTITGAGSTWTSNVCDVFVGYYGSGSLNVLDSGTMTDNANLVVARYPGSTGAMTVSGSGSTVSVADAIEVFVVGWEGTGTLNVSSGGAVVGSCYSAIGYGVGSAGTATVTGISSSWTVNGLLDVGYEGSGVLNITNGGAVTDAEACIGRNATSTGSVTISGSASTWTNSGNLLVGSFGTATVTQTGGTTSVGGTLTLGYNGVNSNCRGTYNLEGGVLALCELNWGDTTTATFNFGGGTMLATGTMSSSLPMNLSAIGGNATVNTNGYPVTLSGALSGAGGLTKIGAGTLTLSAANTYAGNTNLNAGTLMLGVDQAIPSGAGRGNFSGLTGATLDLNGYNQTLNNPSGAFTTTNSGGTASTLTANVTTNPVAYSGVIQDGTSDVAVTKIGSGRWVLSGANTYTGKTTLQAGTLVLDTAAHNNTVLSGGGADIQAGLLSLAYTTGNSPSATVDALMKASYDGGDWDVGQFQSSTAAANGLTLGWFDRGTQVDVKIAVIGDANLDGVVNGTDYGLVLLNYGLSGSAATWATGDVNYDSVVNGTDYGLVLLNYGQTLPPEFDAMMAGGGFEEMSRFSAAETNAVPEPGTLALLAAGLIGLAAFAWRKRK